MEAYQSAQTYDPKIYHTPEAYLALERETTFRHEYVRGEILLMAGGSPNHNLVKEGLSISVGTFLRGKKSCRNYSSDQRIHAYDGKLYTYPDLVVVCGPNQYTDGRQDTLMNPLMIGEVLSPGTEAYDRGDKFKLYRNIPTLTEYLLIDSAHVYAEVYRKHPEAGFWYIADEADTLDGQITLASIGLTLLMADIYEKTDGLLPQVY